MKQIYASVSDQSGNFLATWPSFTLDSISKSINGGLGEAVIQLPVPFSYTGAELLKGNDVEIRVADVDTDAALGGPGHKLIYKGYISLIERTIDSGVNNVTVHLLGYATRLALDILKNSNQTTLYSYASGLTTTIGSFAACDVGLLARSVMDRYIAETVNPKMGYQTTDVPLTSTTVEYAFEQRTYKDALDQCKQMAPAGTFYYIGEDGMLKFGQKAATPKHMFTFGRHFNKVKLSDSLENLRNFFLLWNGEPTAGIVYEHVQDAGSIAQYGRMAATDNDYGVNDTGGADAIGAKFISESKDGEITMVATIIDNNGPGGMGYDIESIQPGDTCTVNGFPDTVAQFFRDNMLITDVQYSPSSVQITVEIVKSGLVDLQSQQGKNIGDLQSGGLKIPPTYT